MCWFTSGTVTPAGHGSGHSGKSENRTGVLMVFSSDIQEERILFPLFSESFECL